MKHLLLSLILFPFLATAQSNVSLDFVVGADYTFRTLYASDNYEFILKVREAEVGKLNGRTGFNFSKRITNRLFLKTGVRLASVGYYIKKQDDVRWESEYSTGEWVPDPNLPHKLSLIKDYWFVEFPLMARLEFNQRKWAPFLEGGVSPSLYVTTRTIIESDFDKNSDFEHAAVKGFNRLQWVGVLSFGMNYNATSRIQLFAQPVLRYHLSNLVKAPVKEHLYTAGLEMGARLKLK